MHIANIGVAKIIVRHFANESAAAAKGCHTGDGVARRTAGHANGFGKQRVRRLRLFRSHEPHGTLDQPILRQNIVVDVSQNIEDRVADPQDIIVRVGQLSSKRAQPLPATARAHCNNPFGRGQTRQAPKSNAEPDPIPRPAVLRLFRLQWNRDGQAAPPKVVLLEEV